MRDSYNVAKDANASLRDRLNAAQHFYFGAIVYVASFLSLGGFPPMAGFFLKLTFVEIFVAHSRIAGTVGFLVIGLAAMWGYFQAISYSKNEPTRNTADDDKETESNYIVRLSSINRADAIVFLLSLIGLLGFVAVSLHAPTLVAFTNATTPFFYDNNNYVTERLIDNLSGGHLAFFFFFNYKWWSGVWERLDRKLTALENKFYPAYNKFLVYTERSKFINNSYAFEFATIVVIFSTIALLSAQFFSFSAAYGLAAKYKVMCYRFLLIIVGNFII